MKYNFDEIIDRRGNQSIKWGVLEDLYGSADLIPLWVADMDFKTSDAIIEALRNRVDQGIYGYTKMEDTYMQSFQNWCLKRHKWSVKKEDIIYSPGVVMSLILLIKSLTNEGDAVIVQPPVYGPFKRSADHHNRKVLNNNMILRDGFYTLDFDDLERQIDAGGKILIFCNPQNPVGRVWKREELLRLSEIVIRRDILVISDEIHCDLIMGNHIHVPLASISEEMSRRTITCMSPTKTFNLAGLQTSVILASDPEIHKRIKYAFETMDTQINNCFGQVAFEAAYNHGEAWLLELLAYIEDNEDYVINFLKNEVPEIKVQKPQGTYLLWLNCKALAMTQDDLKDFMVKEAKLALTDGLFFGEPGRGFMRMNVACPRPVLEKAMTQLSQAMIRKRLK